MSQKIVTDFSDYVFRCHYLGLLMGKGQGKSYKQQYDEAVASKDKKFERYATMNKETITAEKLLEEIGELDERIEMLEGLKGLPHLSLTAKTKLAEIFTNETTGRTRDIENKYIEKGLLLEEDAITQYSLLTNRFFKKNKITENNGFIRGELDFPEDDWVNDTKVSWDIFTFDATAAKKINPIYDWQQQGYMWLFNKKNARLIYSLHNTPEHLIVQEEKRMTYKVQSEEDYKIACAEIRKNHIYNDLPIERKIRVYEIKRDDDKIDQIKQQIPHLRTYLNNMLNHKQDETED